LRGAYGIKVGIGDKQGQAYSLINMGTIHARRGEYEEAAQLFLGALDICQEIGNRRGQATVLTNLGSVSNSRGDYARALGYLEKANYLFRDIGDRNTQASCLNNIGNAHFLQGDLDRAIGRYAQSLSINRELADSNGQAYSLYYLGRAHLERGDISEAGRLLEEAEGTASGTGDRELSRRIAISSAERLLAMAAGRGTDGQEKALLEAIGRASQALELAEGMRSRLGRVEAVALLSRINAALMRWQEAEEGFNEALVTLEEMKQPLEIAKLHYHYSMMLEARADTEAARKHLSTARALFEKIGSKTWIERANQKRNAADD
jgi:tetratricopeptide (TPR) repeat protein